VAKSSTFTVEAELDCHGGECPQATSGVLLNKPVEVVYDDSSAEDYGDIGSTDWYLAVRITPTPESYPAHLRTARFYIWDTTTYPFELRVWDDSGAGGSPGAMLIAPFEVDPVAPSTPVPTPDVAWFDIDLTDRNIVIESGHFYIGLPGLIST